MAKGESGPLPVVLLAEYRVLRAPLGSKCSFYGGLGAPAGSTAPFWSCLVSSLVWRVERLMMSGQMTLPW